MINNHGVNGQILHVDLDSGNLVIERLSDDFYRQYVGGKSLGVYYLLKYLKPGVDPLSPENVLIFSTGPFTGASIAGSGRNSVVSKSPLTSGFASSEAGGFWGPELKRAGFDGIVLTGRAPEPVYLWVHDGKPELKPAYALVGQNNWRGYHSDRTRFGYEKSTPGSDRPGR